MGEIPESIMVISENMNKSPSRATSDPFWQVRHKDYIVTQEGCNEHHFELVCDESGVFYRSDIDDDDTAINFFEDSFSCYHEKAIEYINENGSMNLEYFIYENDLPDGVTKIFVQEVEETVWTGLSESGAKAFIARKQHDYPKLYTYVESAYWSPELRIVMDWIKSFTSKNHEENR